MVSQRYWHRAYRFSTRKLTTHDERGLSHCLISHFATLCSSKLSGFHQSVSSLRPSLGKTWRNIHFTCTYPNFIQIRAHVPRETTRFSITNFPRDPEMLSQVFILFSNFPKFTLPLSFWSVVTFRLFSWCTLTLVTCRSCNSYSSPKAFNECSKDEPHVKIRNSTRFYFVCRFVCNHLIETRIFDFNSRSFSFSRWK